MNRKKISLAVLASLSTIGVASAAPVVLDNWTASQSVTATSASPTVTGTMIAPVSGTAPFLGDRTLTATLTSVEDEVQATIGGGRFGCNRGVEADGFCLASYDTLVNFVLGSIDFGAISDGAFGGSASVEFYKDATLLASQAIATGAGVYSVFAGNTSFSTGDTFSIRLNGTVATDQSLRLVTSNVPEPGSLALAGLGLLGLGFMRRRSVA